jgi:hypothetical protein
VVVLKLDHAQYIFEALPNKPRFTFRADITRVTVINLPIMLAKTA